MRIISMISIIIVDVTIAGVECYTYLCIFSNWSCFRIWLLHVGLEKIHFTLQGNAIYIFYMIYQSFIDKNCYNWLNNFQYICFRITVVFIYVTVIEVGSIQKNCTLKMWCYNHNILQNINSFFPVLKIIFSWIIHVYSF